MPTSRRKSSLGTKEVILLLLGMPDREGVDLSPAPVVGRTRLMKAVFLFEKEVRPNLGKLKNGGEVESVSDFIPYDYGPFCPRLYSDLEFLIDHGLVVEVEDRPETELIPEVSFSEQSAYEAEYLDPSIWQAEVTEHSGFPEAYVTPCTIQVTELGQEYYSGEIATRLTKNQLEAVRKFKRHVVTVPLRTLLEYVYSQYPDYTTNSKIRDEVLKGSLRD